MSFHQQQQQQEMPPLPDAVTDSPGGDHLHERHKRRTASLSSPPSPPPPPANPTKRDHHASVKYISLLLLVGQMVGLVLLMRYTRTHASGDGSSLYLPSTAVFLMELTKFVLCNLLVFRERQYSATGWIDEIRRHTIDSPGEMTKLTVPSLLYTVQNNLLYVALTNLDAATYQILYQLKILTTAVFSVTMLRRRFSRTKWCSLVVLTAGVVVVQLSGSGDKASSSSEEEDDDKNRAVGWTAVLCAACTSGFSGVYFEKILKGSDVSVFIRNVQMGIPSIVIASMACYTNDYRDIRQKGFFVGYNSYVWAVILVQAVGGLIVAVVVKYADNVLKVFASSFSIIFSCLLSAILFDFRPNTLFVSGAGLVCLSTVLYSRPEKKERVVLPVLNGSQRRSQTQSYA